MAISYSNLSVQQLKKAVEIREQIERLEAELNRVLTGASTGSSAIGVRPGGMSSAAREKIAAAQRARWARVKGLPGAKAAPQAAAKSTGRKMSAAARAKIAAAARARWAKVKAGK